VDSLPPFLLDRHSPLPPVRAKEVVSIPFLEKGLHRVSGIVQFGYAHWELSRRDGLFHRIDARVKVLFLAFFLVLVSLKQAIAPEAGIAVLVLALFVLSRLELGAAYKRILTLGFVFGVLIPLPSMFNVLSDGELLLPVLRLEHAYDLWIYHVPETVGVTREGVDGIALLFLRVTNCAALSLLVFYTTPFADILKALRMFRVPDTFVVIIALSYKYLLVFTRTVEEMYLAKRSRLLGRIRGREGRRWVAERMALIYRKSSMQCGEIFKAMVSRAFDGEVKLTGLGKIAARDRWMAVALLGAGALFLVW
jgi:cobalt/nickel transport system permease protein